MQTREPLRPDSRVVRLPRLVPLLVLAMAAAGPAAACQRLVLGDQVLDENRSLPNFDLPNVSVGGLGGFLDNAYTCPPGDTEFVVDAPLAGLTYVRDITDADGDTHAAYAFSDRSLLIGMRYQIRGAAPQPLRPGQRITMSASNTDTDRVYAGVLIRYFLPGGAMESVPYRYLGTVEAWPASDPSQRLLTPISLGFTVPTVTCTLADASHTLEDVVANELAASGSSAKESSFDVAMNCPMDNVDVQLSLADANNPGSSNGQLAPATGTTAGGVQVQLLRNGQPVQFGQAWSHGWSSKGLQTLPFSARYLRTADPLEPGEVKGEAVLTADYR